MPVTDPSQRRHYCSGTGREEAEMNGYGRVGQEHINDLVREAERERIAKRTRRSRETERRSLARLVSLALQGIARH
jgi:hypothetical protein